MTNEVKIEFIDTSTESMKMLKQLSRNALKEAGKTIMNKLEPTLAEHIKTGTFKKSIYGKVEVSKKSGYRPVLLIGYRSRKEMEKKYGVKYYINPYWMEKGTQPHQISSQKGLYDEDGNYYGHSVMHPGQKINNFLSNVVQENIAEIRSAQEKFLKELDNIEVFKGQSINEEGEDEV